MEIIVTVIALGCAALIVGIYCVLAIGRDLAAWLGNSHRKERP